MYSCGLLVSSQIRYLISTLTKKNFKTSCSELAQLVTLYGQDAYIFVMCCLMEQIDFKAEASPVDQLKMRVLKQEMGYLCKQPNFVSVICQAFENLPIQKDFVSLFSRSVKLSLSQEIQLAIALGYAPSVSLKDEGIRFLKHKLAELTPSDLKSLSEDIVHDLIFFIHTHEAFAEQKLYLVGVLQKLQTFDLSFISDVGIADFKRDFSSDSHAYLSQTCTYPHPAQLMEDLGFRCCASVPVFKDLLSQFPMVNERDVALMLGVMVRNCDATGATMKEPNLPAFTSFSPPAYERIECGDLHSWDTSVFVDVVNEMNPRFNWTAVVSHLDHPGFFLKDQKGLALLTSVYRKATNNPFPLENLFSTVWANSSGQLSFLQQVLAGRFSFGQQHQIPIPGPLHRSSTSTPIQHTTTSPWNSPSLLATLLQLGETHHTEVRAIFDTPIKQCPELLLLGLAQIKPSWNNLLRAELLGVLLPLFLQNHRNHRPILSKLFHISPSIVGCGMVEMYTKDPTSLSQIFHISQDLKELTTLLNAQPFSFAIDLAALASHHEFLYLEKWLQDQVNKHGAPFAEACITYIKEKRKPQPPNLNFHGIASFLKVLRNNPSLVPPSILDAFTQPTPKSPTALQMPDISLQRFLPHANAQLSTPSVVHLTLTVPTPTRSIPPRPTPTQPNSAQPTPAQPTSAQPTSAQPTSAQPTLAQPILLAKSGTHSSSPDFEFDQPSLRIASLLKSKDAVQPDEQIKDKIHFIFNNISQANVDVKANEMREMIKEEHLDYVAQYLVVKRIGVEQNFHSLYMTFIEKLNLPNLAKLLLRYTLESVKALLQSPNLTIDISERSVLKNLGSWLGMITLAKNKPLYHQDLCPKDLMRLMYHQGTLTAVVPFVAKILEAGMQSRVFKPPNPWVVAIMRLMAEIYRLPKLKSSLKYEIELLCMHLNINLEQLKPTSLLTKPSRKEIRPSLGNLSTFAVSNPCLALPASLMELVPVAIERAIKEIVGQVAERSVAIALTTTRMLVTKDFIAEPDEEKICHAANSMVQSLAGSLALATCKENLLVSMTKNLHSILGNSEKSIIDHAIPVLCADNLDMASAVIADIASGLATRKISEMLAPFLASRRASGALGSSAGGLLPHQLQVYEGFLSPTYTFPSPSTNTITSNSTPKQPSQTTSAGVAGEKPVQYALRHGTANIPGGYLASLYTEEMEGQTTTPSATTKQIPDLHRAHMTSLFQEFIQLASTSKGSDKKLVQFIAHNTNMQQILHDEKLAEAFYHVCLETVLASQVVSASPLEKQDAFAMLVMSQIRFTGDPQSALSSGHSTQLAVLNRALCEVVKMLAQSYDTKQTQFDQCFFFRIFEKWLIEFHKMEDEDSASATQESGSHTGNPFHLQILLAFGKALKTLSPSQFPGFAFAWLELVAHRSFMGKLLSRKEGWSTFQGLLEELIGFLAPFLRTAELSEPIKLLYKATLRVLLVILHDFPEFLCAYHFSLCNPIPPSCIQMRNIILSAFPREMRLPNPFTPNLKVDLLPEINQAPSILSNYLEFLPFTDELDTYLEISAPTTFLSGMHSRLQLTRQDGSARGTKYNVPVMNALVLHVGVQAIQNKSVQFAATEIFQHLVLELDPEGRYFFLNAVANQLRYPNSHTYYFSCILLHLFAEDSQEVIQEQITRVLLERLIVNRPHPWGTLITFVELIKNPKYKFRSCSFTHCVPEIGRIFESVARVCMGAPAQNTNANIVQRE